MNWQEKTILVTGGTGSFGKMFAKTALAELKPKKLIVFSRDELKQHEMRLGGFDQDNIRFFIGDVRDRDRLKRAMTGVDVVVHAAALKQVPACEYNPIEAVQTNIIGGENVINAALDAGVQRVLAMSTDKAVNPVNLYGATKLCAEKLFVHSNVYSGDGRTKFSCVRYGNVVGSRGSVVPVFIEQRKTGRVTVTDDRMTRFWLTLEQGVRFVIGCIEKMQGAEVFIPRIPSMKIVDLATMLAPDCRIEVTGIRPGEKLHEALVAEDEARHGVAWDGMYVLLPPHVQDPLAGRPGAKPLPDGFRYTSDNNDEWLSADGLKAMVKEFGA